MSRSYIPKALRERVTAQARHRCGYCLTSEAIVGTPMEIDHIVPESLGGQTEEDNLWLACSLCNDHKSDRIAALIPSLARSCDYLIRVIRYGVNTLPGRQKEIALLV